MIYLTELLQLVLANITVNIIFISNMISTLNSLSTNKLIITITITVTVTVIVIIMLLVLILKKIQNNNNNNQIIILITITIHRIVELLLPNIVANPINHLVPFLKLARNLHPSNLIRIRTMSLKNIKMVVDIKDIKLMA